MNFEKIQICSLLMDHQKYYTDTKARRATQYSLIPADEILIVPWGNPIIAFIVRLTVNSIVLGSILKSVSNANS